MSSEVTVAMLTLTLAPHYTITRSLLAPRRVGLVGSAPLQAQRQWARDVSSFVLRATNQNQALEEYLWSFAVYHQGDRPFWWDGNVWETQQAPVYVGTGDGITTEFFLPNRHITNTPSVYVDGVLASPQPSIDSAPGLLTFVAPVTLAEDITALYTCKYKLAFVAEGETLLNEEQFHSALWRVEGLNLREVVP